jgi:hypothetical protein
MKDIFKLILALPFIGFQAGGSVVLGCLGFIFYAWCVFAALGGIFFIFYNIYNSFHGDVNSMKYIGFLALLCIATLLSVEIYWKIKQHYFPTKG